jgi:hypothetical protein
MVYIFMQYILLRTEMQPFAGTIVSLIKECGQLVKIEESNVSVFRENTPLRNPCHMPRTLKLFLLPSQIYVNRQMTPSRSRATTVARKVPFLRS